MEDKIHIDYTQDGQTSALDRFSRICKETNNGKEYIYGMAGNYKTGDGLAILPEDPTELKQIFQACIAARNRDSQVLMKTLTDIFLEALRDDVFRLHIKVEIANIDYHTALRRKQPIAEA